MKNRTNLTKYRIWAPIYDPIMGNKLFKGARKRAFALLGLHHEQKILLVGVGTGEDFCYIPKENEITGIDLSEAMLEKAKIKAKDHKVQLILMNAEELTFPDCSFDVVVLSLILSVVENPRTAMREAVRVLQPGGLILVFDKFVSKGGKPNVLRRMFNMLTSLAGTDINRSIEDIARGLELRTLKREDSILGGSYKVLVLEKVS
jgi:ubiquinone/menaquinone biosynthesis C-methylase UbiE